MRLWVIAGLAVGLTGCVSSGDMELLHREITDVSRQVENLGRQSSGKDDLQAMSRKLAEQTGRCSSPTPTSRWSSASSATRSSPCRPTSTPPTSGSRRSPTSWPPRAIRAPWSSLRRPTPARAAHGRRAAGRRAPRGNEPTQLYNAAYEDYLRSNFDLAIQGFREYAKRYPSTDLADNALYWVGESYYSKKQFKEAIDAFTELLNTYKTSDKAAAALLKKGLAYLEMGDRSQAVINLQYVLYEHPGSKEAELARARLQALGVKVK